MRGFCKTDCGIEVEYDPYEFTDGFVYYLPRDLDGKVHKCIFTDQEDDYDSFEDFLSHNSERCKLTQDEYEFVMSKWNYDDMFGEPMDVNFLEMIRKGKMFELKKYVDELLTNEPMPYLENRFTDSYQVELESDWVELPTNKGYQLEYLGKIYEIMIRLEDAKKCYELQYECTKEPELLQISRELDKKIQDTQYTKQFRENIPKNIDIMDVQNIIDLTEINIRKYIVVIFSNNFTELFKIDPTLKEQCEKIRKNDEDSMLNFEEISYIDTVMLGSLLYIIKISRGKKHSDSEGTCKICKGSWKINQYIFSQVTQINENDSEEIRCIYEECFVKQGGLVKNTPGDLIKRIEFIKNTRNAIHHTRKPEHEEMFKKSLAETYVMCDYINIFLEDFFKQKKLT